MDQLRADVYCEIQPKCGPFFQNHYWSEPTIVTIQYTHVNCVACKVAVTYLWMHQGREDI